MARSLVKTHDKGQYESKEVPITSTSTISSATTWEPVTGASVTLEPGKWLVHYIMQGWMRNNSGVNDDNSLATRLVDSGGTVVPESHARISDNDFTAAQIISGQLEAIVEIVVETTETYSVEFSALKGSANWTSQILLSSTTEATARTSKILAVKEADN